MREGPACVDALFCQKAASPHSRRRCPRRQLAPALLLLGSIAGTDLPRIAVTCEPAIRRLGQRRLCCGSLCSRRSREGAEKSAASAAVLQVPPAAACCCKPAPRALAALPCCCASRPRPGATTTRHRGVPPCQSPVPLPDAGRGPREKGSEGESRHAKTADGGQGTGTPAGRF